jgi:tetratricopeptide (TPR) repeat protein
MRQNKAKTPDAGAEIESAIERDDWPGARKLIEEELAKDPDDHWLLTRLSLTYYEQFDYQKALDLSERALSIAPECPLAKAVLRAVSQARPRLPVDSKHGKKLGIPKRKRLDYAPSARSLEDGWAVHARRPFAFSSFGPSTRESSVSP